jgi:hypothetical protein
MFNVTAWDPRTCPWILILFFHLILAWEPPFCILYTFFSQGPFFTASLTSCSIPAVLKTSLSIRVTHLSSLRVRRASNKLPLSPSQSRKNAFSVTTFLDQVEDLFKVASNRSPCTRPIDNRFDLIVQSAWVSHLTKGTKSPTTIRGSVHPVWRCQLSLSWMIITHAVHLNQLNSDFEEKVVQLFKYAVNPRDIDQLKVYIVKCSGCLCRGLASHHWLIDSKTIEG